MYIQIVLLDIIIVFWKALDHWALKWWNRMIFNITRNTLHSPKSYHHAKSSGTILATSYREASSIQCFTFFQSWRYKTKIAIERHKTP